MCMYMGAVHGQQWGGGGQGEKRMCACEKNLTLAFTSAIFILQARKWHAKLYDRNSGGSTVWPHEKIADCGL